MGVLSDLTVKFTADISGLTNGVSQARENISSLSGIAQSSGGGILSGFTSAVGGVMSFVGGVGLAINGAKSMYDATVSMGHALLDSNASMETTQVAFTTLLGNTQKATDYMKQLQQFAAATPLEFPQIATAAQHMLAFGFQAKDVIPTLTNIGDAMSALGHPEGLEEVVQVFGQIHAAGKLNAGDIMQLADRGIPAWQMLAKEMGKTVPEVQKLTSQGLIPADTAINALSKGMHESFGGGMAAQSATFSGLMSTLKDNAESAWRAFTGPIFQLAKSGLTEMGNIVSGPQFQSFATNMGKLVGGALQGIVSFVQGTVIPAFKQLGTVFQSPEFQTMQSAFTGLGVTIQTQLMPALAPLIGRFQSLFANQSVSGGADLLKQAFVGIRDAVNGVSGFIQNLSGKLSELGPKLAPVIEAFLRYGSTVRSTFSTIMTVVGPIIAGIMNIVGQLAGFIIQMLPSIYNIMSQIMAGIGNVFKTVGPVITGSLIPAIQRLISVIGPVVVQIVQWIEKSGILPVIFNIIGLALKTMIQIIADNINRITTIIQIIITVITAVVTGITFAVNAIRTAWSAVVGWVTAAVNAVRTVIMSVWNSIMTWWHTSTTGAVNNVHSTFSGIQGWLGAIWAAIQVGIQSAWNNVLNFFRNIFNNIVSTISGAVNTVVGWFQWLYNHNYYFQMLVDFIRNIISNVVNWLTTTWSNIVNFISGRWAYLSAYANAYWAMIQMEIQSKVQQVVSWLQGIWNNVVGWISEQWARLRAYANMYWAMIQMEIQNVVNQVVNFLQSKWSQLSQLAQNAWNAVVGVFRNAWGGISGALSGIWNNISNWFSNLASQAITWGKNIINGFIDGINSMVGAAGNAASNIVANVAKTLGFHSPAKEGPGKDADTWAPNLMRMFIGGITAAVPQVRSATLSVVNELAALNGSSSSYQYTGRSNSLGMLAVAQAQSSREQHIHVHVGNEEIAHYVTNEQMKMVRLGGYRR